MEDYLENTFGLEDIFATKTISDLRNTSKFQLREVRTLFNGRVFVICPVTMFKVLDRIYLELLKNHEFKFSIHYPGEEFWFVFPRFLVQPSNALIETNKMWSADIAVAEQRRKFLMKGLNPCKEYKIGGFASCIKNALTENFDRQLKCILPGIEDTLSPKGGKGFGY